MVFILFAFTIACEKDRADSKKSGIAELEIGQPGNMYESSGTGKTQRHQGLY